MSLPIAWVDCIFDRMIVRYGDRFLSRWKGVDMDAVRFDWANVLSGFVRWPEAISYALENLDDEKPPTATMFRAVASRAPKITPTALPAPKPDPEMLAVEFEKLAKIRASIVASMGNKVAKQT